MNCSKCGAVNEPEDKFCKSCGQPLDAPVQPETSAATETTPSFDPALNGRKRARKKAVWISTAAAVIVVLGGGAVFASTAHVFASGKTLMLDAVTNAASSQDAPVAENIHLSVKNLSVPNAPQLAGAMASTLNNSTIDLNMVYRPADKKAQLDFNTQYQSVEHHGSLWITKDSAVLSASDYAPLLKMISPSLKLPQYLVTDSSQSKDIEDFWAQIAKNKDTFTGDKLVKLQNVEKLVIQAIPDKYIHRKGLTTVDIEFDQAGLEDILKSEVKTVYSNKDQIADVITALGASAATQSGVSASDLKQQFLDALDQTPEEVVLGSITTAMHSGYVTMEPMTISATKGLFSSQIKDSITGGVSIKDSASGTSGTIDFSLNAETPTRTQVQMPSTNSANSQTFLNWMAQMGGLN